MHAHTMKAQMWSCIDHNFCNNNAYTVINKKKNAALMLNVSSFGYFVKKHEEVPNL